MVFLIIGAGLVALAVLFVVLGKLQSNKSLDIRAAQTYTAANLQQQLGNGSLSEGRLCEVKGIIECDNPLVAPMTKQPCVAYNHQVERRYEERDSDGSTRTNSETVHHDSRQVNFWVRDETGRVLILPERAQLELIQSASHFESGPSMGFQIDLSRGVVDFQAGSGTNGFHYTESVLPLGQQVYVLGSLQNRQGQPVLAARDKQRFLISWRSEEELVQSAAKWTTGFYAVAGLLVAVGLGLMGFGLIR
jgi:hypothetical protein